MFTGLIQTIACLESRIRFGNAGKLLVKTRSTLRDLEPGESIAVNGACLTLEKADGNRLFFHVLEETFACTNLGLLPAGAELNLERAMKAGDRFGGHVVSGHVDATARILEFGKKGADTVLTLEIPEKIRPYLVPKGSIAVDGISLTIAALTDSAFSLCIIPSTWERTNLQQYRPGDKLNLEADLTAKHIHTQLQSMRHEESAAHLTMDDLKKAGF